MGEALLRSTQRQDAAPKRARGQVQGSVYDQLRRGLMVGAFVPGQVLSLRKLAAGFGTSPMPIREALVRLVVANALQPTEGGSVRVPLMTVSRLNELFSIREQLEGMATEQACRKQGPRLVDELTTINKQLLSAIDKRNLIECLSANQRFHFKLYEAAGSEVLMPMIESLWLQFGPTMYLSLLLPDVPWDASAHATILTGLREGKPAMAKKGIVEDVRTTGKSLERALSAPKPFGTLPDSLTEMYFHTPA